MESASGSTYIFYKVLVDIFILAVQIVPIELTYYLQVALYLKHFIIEYVIYKIYNHKYENIISQKKEYVCMVNNEKEVIAVCKSTSSVTALLPAWQSADFIQDTLDSLSAQIYDNFQVIVSVDFCEDDTYAICIAHAEQDSRFRVIKQTKRLGYSGNCSFLLEEADSDYVMFAFHDDTVAPDYISSLAAVLDARPEVILSYSDVLYTAVNGQQEHWVFSALEGEHDRLKRGAKMLIPVGRWWVPNRGLFRLNEVRQINGVKINGGIGYVTTSGDAGDMSLLGEFARVPKTLCYKYRKPGSITLNMAFSPRQRYEVRASCMRELWNSELSSEEKAKLAGPLTNWLINTKPEKETLIRKLLWKLRLKILTFRLKRI